MFTAALLTTAKTGKQPKCLLTDERVKMWCTFTMEYYSAIKKNELMPFVATWMDLEMINHIKENKSEKDKYYMITLIHGGEKWKQWQILFSWAPKSLLTVTATTKLKDGSSLEEKL